MPGWTLLVDSIQAFVVQGGLLSIIFVPVAAGIVVAAFRRQRLAIGAVGLTVAAVVLLVVFGPPPTGDWLNVTGLFPFDSATIGYRNPIILGTTFQLTVAPKSE